MPGPLRPPKSPPGQVADTLPKGGSLPYGEGWQAGPQVEWVIKTLTLGTRTKTSTTGGRQSRRGALAGKPVERRPIRRTCQVFLVSVSPEYPLRTKGGRFALSAAGLRSNRPPKTG